MPGSRRVLFTPSSERSTKGMISSFSAVVKRMYFLHFSVSPSTACFFLECRGEAGDPLPVLSSVNSPFLTPLLHHWLLPWLCHRQGAFYRLLKILCSTCKTPPLRCRACCNGSYGVFAAKGFHPN